MASTSNRRPSIDRGLGDCAGHLASTEKLSVAGFGVCKFVEDHP